jgi:hypothetical protein
MALTRAQKKYLKKNLKRHSLAKIAVDLGIAEKEILGFLKTHWRKEKYQKFLKKQKHLRGEAKQKPRGCLKGEWFKKHWKALAFLAFLVFAVYLNSLGNDFVSDDSAINQNPEINQISYFLNPPYFNLDIRSLIIFLTHKVFGLNPAFYRLINILFHLGSVWIIYLLITFFFASPIPLFTASIFAVHPLLLEAITWISGGHYSLGVFFALFSFLAYISFFDAKKPKLYLFSLLLFYLALLSSEKLVIFPLILLIYEFTFKRLKARGQKLIPFFALSGFWALYLFGLFGARITTLETTFYQEPGINNPLIQIPIAITSYLELIFWPKNLTLYHSEMLFTQIEYLLRLSGFILLLALIGYFYKNNKKLFFWLTFFLISLLPYLTPLRISWVVAERYVYLGALGIFNQ